MAGLRHLRRFSNQHLGGGRTEYLDRPGFAVVYGLQQLVGTIIVDDLFVHRIPTQFSAQRVGDVSQMAGGDAAVRGLGRRDAGLA